MVVKLVGFWKRAGLGEGKRLLYLCRDAFGDPVEILAGEETLRQQLIRQSGDGTSRLPGLELGF